MINNNIDNDCDDDDNDNDKYIVPSHLVHTAPFPSRRGP